MKEVNLENLKDAAHRLLFDMSESEYLTLLKEFETVKLQMKIIADNKKADALTPMIYPFECEVNALREDVAVKPLDREVALKNAKSKLAGQIKLPKVVS